MNESGVTRALEGNDVAGYRKQKADPFHNNKHFQNTSSISGCVISSMDPRDKGQTSFDWQDLDLRPLGSCYTFIAVNLP